MVPQQVDEEGFSCQLPGGEEVNFYQLLPLYEDEMEYKIQSGANSLLELYEGTSFIVDPERPNLLAEDTPLTQDEIKDLLDRMDDAEWHLQDLREKQLPVEELTAYNHLAIYLRWNLEHGRMSEEFRSRYKELMQQFAADPSGTDLRLFIRDELGGILRHSMFDEEGSAFSSYYYGQNEAPYFPSDIDDYALRRFGPEEYFAEKYQDETYLFIPFDEVYYQDMAQLIQQRWEAWQQYEPSDEEPDELAQATMQYLGCDCEYFPPMRDDDPITAAYSYARRRGMEEGFLPVLVVPSESLWETLILNSDPDSDGAEDYGFDPVRVAKYRKMALSAAPLDGKAILKARIEERIAELEENNIRREEILGEMEGGEPQDRLLSYWDYDTQRTCPMILANGPGKTTLGDLCLPALRRLERLPGCSGTHGSFPHLGRTVWRCAGCSHPGCAGICPACSGAGRTGNGACHRAVLPLPGCGGTGGGRGLHRLAGRCAPPVGQVVLLVGLMTSPFPLH